MLLARFGPIRYNTGVMVLPVSARVRRRASWAGGAVLVAGAAAATIALLPSGGRHQPVLHLSGPGQVVTVPKAVPLTKARREAMNALLDEFVPAAVLRRDPARALPLVTPAFRSGTPTAEWKRGNLPVLPYHARGERFHGWTVGYVNRDEMSIDLMLHPSARETLGAETFTVVFKRLRGRWLIDSFVPSASFSPVRAHPRVTAQADYSPGAKLTPIDKPVLDKHWLLLPAALFALVVLLPAGVLLAHWHKGRRAWRAYRRSYELSSR
jgi:hypothetical protein